jgi:hypothetical protein
VEVVPTSSRACRNFNFGLVFYPPIFILLTMKRTGPALLLLTTGLLLCPTQSQAIIFTAERPGGGNFATPYQAISERNVFGLKPPPAPPDPEANKPQPPKITPTGLTTILGKKMALFKVQMPAKPPEPAHEQSMILAEGEREGEIEVVSIDEKLGEIKFNNYGSAVSLSLEKDGAKLPASAAPVAGVPPPNAVGSIPPPTHPAYGSFAPNGGSITTIGSGLKTIPNRQLRVPGNGMGGPAFGGSPNYNGTATAQSQTAANQQPALSPEESAILIEVERERTKEAVSKGLLPPPPPTSLTPPGSIGLPAPGSTAPNKPVPQ